MNIDFTKGSGLVPAVVQDANTSKVLMLGYMNQQALEETLSRKKVTFFSRSKHRLWTKGETSGNYLELVEVIPDCDNDTLLVKAIPNGPVCHTGSDTCFKEESARGFVFRLESVIADRKTNPKEGSYTNYLFEKGVNKIAQKIGEEATELVIEAVNDNLDNFKNEAADLLYHYVILLQEKNIKFEDIEEVLRTRHEKSETK
jgi:phosphoribosyl-ATP pyrophosphohydrolase/phosphoribosyl-AMP cyclohydrolase